MKNRLLCGALLLLCLLGIRLGTGASAYAQNPDFITVTDDLGRVVEVPLRPARVAALTGSFADIWSLAGGLNSLVATADDTWTSFELELDENVVNLGAVRAPDLEKVIASEPDLILASAVQASHVQLLPALEAMGFKVLCFDVSNFTEYLGMLDRCTQITDRPENMAQYGEEVRKQVEAALAMQDGSEPTVLYIRASAGSFQVKGSEGNVLGEMLADLGCRNVADGDNHLLEDLSLEVILAEEPDDIFILYQAADPAKAQALLEESLLSNPAWSGLRAVREGRVYVMEHRLYNLKPNDKWGLAYEKLAQILYGGTE